jgi:hypothetical protein
LIEKAELRMDLGDWGTFLSGLGTLILALVAIAILTYDVQLRRRQLRENRSRSYATLNVEFQVSVHPKIGAHSGSPEWILESRLILKNASTEMFAVPAVYIYAHALPEVSNEGALSSISEADFDLLRPIGPLSEPKNVAWFPSAIWHLGPDEVDSVVRWDVVAADLIRAHPVVIVRAVVYSVPNEFIGAAYGSTASTDRTEWTEFMESDGGARHKKFIFSHATDNADGIKQGDWVFRKTDSDEIDVEASKRFRKTLVHLCQTGRQNLVVFSGAEANHISQKERPTRGLKQTDAALSRGPAA